MKIYEQKFKISFDSHKITDHNLVNKIKINLKS